MKDDGYPAFPVTNINFPNGTEGISRRDYFAAHAPITLQDAIDTKPKESQQQFSYGGALRVLSQMRYAYADEMLKARLPEQND